jgi:hypothetical protein
LPHVIAARGTPSETAQTAGHIFMLLNQDILRIEVGMFESFKATTTIIISNYMHQRNDN